MADARVPAASTTSARMTISPEASGSSATAGGSASQGTRVERTGEYETNGISSPCTVRA